MSDFLDIISKGLDNATLQMGEGFTISGVAYRGVFSATSESVDYESMSGYDTEVECNLTLPASQLSTKLAVNTEVIRSDSSIWLIVEGSTPDDLNYDYRLKKKES